MNNVIYAYRVTRSRSGYASCVCRIENGLRVYGTSYAEHPDRHRAYRYAKSMAKIQAMRRGAGVQHYDKIHR